MTAISKVLTGMIEGRSMRRLHLEKTRAGVLFHLQITVDMELPCWELQQEMGGHQMG